MSCSKLSDELYVDPPLRRQNYVVVSFLSPEKILKNKDVFMFSEFVKGWDLEKSLDKFTQFVNFIAFKYHLKPEDIAEDMKEFVAEETDKIRSFKGVNDDYKTFLEKNEERLNDQFNEEHNLNSSVRGVKISGVFETEDEAAARARIIAELHPNEPTFIGNVGKWTAWDHDLSKCENVDYMNDELNKLMHEKIKNDNAAKAEFDARLLASKRKAIEDNVKKAEESGAVLTQTIDEHGRLINLTKSNEDVGINELKSQIFGNNESDARLKKGAE